VRDLTIDSLKTEARGFADIESSHSEPALFGVDNGKTVGTYCEHKFQAYLHGKYEYEEGSSAVTLQPSVVAGAGRGGSSPVAT
jgi:hypothetical protein